MSTPLKTPITTTIATVEGAVLFAAIVHCGSWLLKGVSENLIGLGINIPEDRLIAMAKANGGRAHKGPLEEKQIARDLLAQGIDWKTWQPLTPITIGGYPVEFKPDCIKVGCKTIPHATVKAIAERLEKPVMSKCKELTVEVFDDLQLCRIVQQLALDAGFAWYVGGRVVQDYKCRYLLFGKDMLIQYGNVERRKIVDARKDFGSVLDFFRQPAVPEIKVENETVKFNADSIEVFGETVSKETVGQIIKRIEAQATGE